MKQKALKLLEGIIKAKPQEHVSLHQTVSGKYVVACYSGPNASHADTLEDAIIDYHGKCMGFSSIEKSSK